MKPQIKTVSDLVETLPTHRSDFDWCVGDRVQFIQPEFTHCQNEILQDTWIGDTGVIIGIFIEQFVEETDWSLWFDIQIDQSCLDDDRRRWCKYTTGDRHNVINLDQQGV